MPRLTVNNVNIDYLDHYWTPKEVPTLQEYEVLRSSNDTEFREYLKQRKEEMRDSFDIQNPFSWKFVGILIVATAMTFTLDMLVETRWLGLIAVILYLLTLREFLATGWSRDYCKAHYSQRKFYRFVREAAKTYDYPTFVRFVETKLLKMDYKQNW